MSMTAPPRFLHPGDQADHDRLAAPDALANTARWYGANGIAVFPLTPGAKTPWPGSRGFKDATTDLVQITEWWDAAPAANIGLPTGIRWDVLDIDGADGFRSLVQAPNELLEELTANRVAAVNTPRGAHWYMPTTGHGNRVNLLPHVDWRGAGGYVVAPPSVVDGRMYRWTTPPETGDMK